MIISIVSTLFILSPLCEWTIHYLLHTFKNNRHKLHHNQFHNNNLKIEIWPFYFFVIFLLFEYYYSFMMLSKYLVIHSIIHFYPECFPTLTKHHIIHHRNNNVNFCVSATWPDKFFSTFKTD